MHCIYEESFSPDKWTQLTNTFNYATGRDQILWEENPVPESIITYQ